jgi:hypothetical protein
MNMKKILVNIIVTIMSIAAAIFIILVLNSLIVDVLFIKIILIITAIAYGLVLPYYIWKQN